MPWCNDAGELELFHLESMESWRSACTRSSSRGGAAAAAGEAGGGPEIDLVMVPGRGVRRAAGGWGTARATTTSCSSTPGRDAPLVALAFECQLFPEIPTGEHDIFMDKIITEKRVIEGRGRKNRG